MNSKRIDDIRDSGSGESPDLLTTERLLDAGKVVKPAPEGAWQRFLYSISGKLINLGDSQKVRAHKEQSARIAANIPGGTRFVPVLSRKGGVGKTTVTTLIGMALADVRDDRIVAVDANPDRGTLAERTSRTTQKTVRDLVREREEINGYSDLSAIVTRDATRLDIIASDSNPRVAEAFNGEDYSHVAEIASRYYSIVLTDTGTGIVHSVMAETLGHADTVVIVAGTSIDEAKLASETLTWLETNGYEQVAREAIVVLNRTAPGVPVVLIDELETHFKSRVKHVVRIPYDAHIASGSHIDYLKLRPDTLAAARQIADHLVTGLRTTNGA